MDPEDQVLAGEEPLLETDSAGGEAEVTDDLDPSVLAAQLAEARAETARYEKRLADTQAWAHQANQERQQLQAALAQAAASPQRQAPVAPLPATAPQIPQLTDQEAELFATDPQFANRRIIEAASAAARFAVEQATRIAAEKYEPVIAQLYQQAQATNSMLPSAIEPAVAQAATQAAEMAERSLGIPKDQFAASLEPATQLLWEATNGNMVEFNRLRMNPSTLMHTVVEARIRSGATTAPAHRPAVPPTVGASPRNPAAPPPPPRTALPEGVSRIAEVFGAFTPEQMKQIQQAR